MKSSLNNIDDKVTRVIKEKLHTNKQKQAVSSAPLLPHDLTTNQQLSTHNDVADPDHIDTIDVEIVNADCVTSDDEFVPDIPVDNIPLNSKVLTSQQRMLML